MPAIRKKSSQENASCKRYRKPIKVSYAYDSSSDSEEEEEYLDLETELGVASRSKSNTESFSGVSSVRGATNDAMEAEPMTISGILLRPTVAFDTFWRFAAERKAIDDRRRAGKPAP